MYFFTYLFPYLFTFTKIGPFHVQAMGRKRQPNLAFV